jgi:hypothetical protein
LILGGEVTLWVNFCRADRTLARLLYPQKLQRRPLARIDGHKRHFAPQKTASFFNGLVDKWRTIGLNLILGCTGPRARSLVEVLHCRRRVTGRYGREIARITPP